MLRGSREIEESARVTVVYHQENIKITGPGRRYTLVEGPNKWRKEPVRWWRSIKAGWWKKIVEKPKI